MRTTYLCLPIPTVINVPSLTKLMASFSGALGLHRGFEEHDDDRGEGAIGLCL